jgi:hypothetical protein
VRHVSVNAVAVDCGINLINVCTGVASPIRVFLHVEHEIGIELVSSHRFNYRAMSPRALRGLSGHKRADYSVVLEGLVDCIDPLIEEVQLHLSQIDSVFQENVEMAG